MFGCYKKHKAQEEKKYFVKHKLKLERFYPEALNVIKCTVCMHACVLSNFNYI